MRRPPPPTLFPYTTLFRSYSRAITAPWVISPPTSVTSPLIETNNGVQLGSVNEVINISDRKSTRLNSSHVAISYAVFCLKQKAIQNRDTSKHDIRQSTSSA